METPKAGAEHFVLPSSDVQLAEYLQTFPLPQAEQNYTAFKGVNQYPKHAQYIHVLISLCVHRKTKYWRTMINCWSRQHVFISYMWQSKDDYQPFVL